MLSIPLSSVMIESVSENMLMESSEANFGINVLCAAGIVLLVWLSVTLYKKTA